MSGSSASGEPVARFLRASDGARLYLRELGSPDASRTVVLVHGYGEHGGRYLRRVRPLLNAGFRVLIPDVRGHGRSDGPRGHVMRFGEYLDDLATVFREVRTPTSHTGLLAHSHGGLIACRHLLSEKPRVCAAALTSPLLGIAVKPPAWKVAAGRWMSRIAPRVSLPTEIQAEWVSHDPAVVEAYGTDPYNHHVNNARWFTEAVSAMEACFVQATALSVPTLVLQAGDDKLVSAEASARWAAASGATYEEIAGAYHEVLFELDGATHVARVSAFLDQHVGGAA